MNQKTKVDEMNELREINNFYQPPPTAGLKSGQQAIPIWKSESNGGFSGKIPAHLEWSTGEQGRLVRVMNDRNNILEKIEELKYAAECLEDLINDWENNTITLG